MPRDLSAQQVGLQGKPSATQPKYHVFTGRTEFPMSYPFPNTYRYGHVQPFYYQHTVGDDDIPLYAQHDLHTYTMASPMKSPVTLSKSYFLVDYKAIYPRNWNLMYVAPNKGDDVPADTRFVVSNLIHACYSRLALFKAVSIDDNVDYAFDWIRFVLLLESIFSAGSLFAQFDIHLQDFCVGNTSSDLTDGGATISFDTWFDTVFVPSIEDISVIIDGKTYYVGDKAYYDAQGNYYSVTMRRLLEMMRSNRFTINVVPSNLDDSVSQLFITQDVSYPINLEVIAAYQLGCAQFFTDSSVDYVYSAELYRDSLEQVYRGLWANFSDMQFTYNGSTRLYDILSGFCLNKQLASLGSSAIGVSFIDRMYDWFAMLFGHRQSLRFGDYFVSGKPTPYGTGDMTVNTSGATVSVIDITTKIQLQRFWNRVTNTPQKIGDYARNVLGLSNADDNSYDIPAFLGHKTCLIGGMEVENTADGQRDANSITTHLKANQNVHAFDIHTKRPGIIIGVMSFDVPRIYSKTVDRMHMHQTRFDDYIPELQFTGDQPIYQRELDATKPVNGIFAYSLKYMEYKRRYGYAAGGAIEALNTWFMITDNKDGNPFSGNIDPDYIRSQPSEFDRFYSALTGYSLGTYFHFIVMNHNYQKLTRDMVLAPEPLK